MVGMNESIHLTSDHLIDASPSFEEFVENHHARLYGALCLVTGDRYEAEEVAQEAFLEDPREMGPRIGSAGSGRLLVSHSDERVPWALPPSESGDPPCGRPCPAPRVIRCRR